MSCLDVVIRSLRNALEATFKPIFGVCVRFARLGGISAHYERLDALGVDYDRISANLRTNIGLICSVGVGKYEYLACSDLGYIRTFDRGYIIVPKH